MSSGASRAVVVALTALIAVAVAPVAAFAQNDSLAEKGRVQYTVDPQTKRINAFFTLVVTNQSDSDVRKMGPFYVEDRAVGIKTTGATPKVKDLDGPWKQVKLKLGAPLRPSESRQLTLSHVLKSNLDDRANDPMLLGEAYAYFCVPGQDTDTGSVNVKLAKGYSPTVFGDPLEENAQDVRYRLLDSGRLNPPTGFFSCVEAVNEAALVEQTFKGPDDREIVLQSWSDSDDWADVAEQFGRPALDALSEFIGQPLPGTGPIVVRESAPQAHAGAHANTEVVQLSESVLDTVEHDLAHAWFGAATFQDPWLREGLATWAAAGAKGETCELPAEGPQELNLRNWQFPKPGSPTDLASQEAAACGIVAAILDPMDPGARGAVLGSLLKAEEKYVGSGTPEAIPTTGVTWAEWLDAIDERGLVPAGDVDLDRIQTLLLDYGIGDPEKLAQRSASRKQYHEFLAASAPIGAPRVVREAMNDWRFDDAVSYLATAGTVLQTLRDADLQLPDVSLAAILQPDFEGAKTKDDLLTVASQAEQLKELAVELAQPLLELQAAMGDWRYPAAVRDALATGEPTDARDAITPALAVATQISAADAALPEAKLRDAFRAQFESAANPSALQNLVDLASERRSQAETTGVELSALRGEAGDWTMPPAVDSLVSSGQLVAATEAIRDARAIVIATKDARQALPEVDVASVIRPLFEGAASASALAAARVQAVTLRDEAAETGSSLTALRTTAPGFTMPAVIVDPVVGHDFEVAAPLIKSAQEWLDFAVAADLSIQGLGALEGHRSAFETATSAADLEAGRDLAESQAQGAAIVGRTIDGLNNPRDLLTQFGMVGSDLSGPTRVAVAAALAGDVTTATETAAEINTIVGQASRGGGLRLAGLVFLGVALFGVLGLWLVLRRDKRPPWAKQSRPPWAR